MKKTILIALIALGFAACKKSTPDVVNKQNPTILNLIIGNEVDPEGFIQAYSLFNGENNQYSFYGYFKNLPDDTSCVDVGTLAANCLNVPIYSNENNNYKLSLVSGTSSTNNWLGNALNINIAGNGGFVPQTINHPNLNEFTTFTLSGISGLNNDFNKDDSLSISWNATNSSNSVFIELEYILDTANPNSTHRTIKKYIQVSDNGTYKIPPSFFTEFPDNSLCLLNIYRGNYENYTASNYKHIGVLTYSVASRKIHLM